MSMKPGATILPVTSITRSAPVRSTSLRETAAMRSPRMATSAVNRSDPVPSMTVPPTRTTS